MKISLRWLQEFFPKKTFNVEDLADKLTMSGLEVETITDTGKNLKGVIIGHVLSKKKHPNADRLSICEVDLGGGFKKQIVCGAANVREGLKVAVAPVGTLLPNGMKIEKSKIRGEMSEGMICSVAELGLSVTSEGILELPDKVRVGKPFADEMDLQDAILEIAITPNRGDALSYLGIAREISAIYYREKLTYQLPEFKLSEKDELIDKWVGVKIEDPKACPRYTCRIIKNLKVGPSPEWMQRRLQLSGIRPINNLVDVTNYILLELGQPLHAFDFDKLQGGKIIVRRAKEGETIITLDGKERALNSKDILICDSKVPIALGGVMGGVGTDVSPSTKTVLLESAYFDPAHVRITSRRLGLISESSYRFERGVDPDGVLKALDRAAAMIAEFGDGDGIKGSIDCYPTKVKGPEILFRPERATKILGATIKKKESGEILVSLGCELLSEKGEHLRLKPPTWRLRDLLRETDLIEEVARLKGYDQIKDSLPRGSWEEGVLPPEDPLFSLRNKISNHLNGLGWLETIHFSFLSPSLLKKAAIEEKGASLVNPLGEEFSVLRPSLLPSLLECVRKNLFMQSKDLKLYEVRSVFHSQGKGKAPVEEFHFTGVMTGSARPRTWSESPRPVSFFDLKGVVESLLQSLRLPTSFSPSEEKLPFLHPFHQLLVNTESINLGWVGEVHPQILDNFEIEQPVVAFELNLTRILSISLPPVKYNSISRFPTVSRDLAIVMPREEPVETLLNLILKEAPKTLQTWELFDLYEGERIPEDKKSVAISLTFGAMDKTLTDQEVDSEIQRLVGCIQKGGRYNLRG